jgi:isocitrate/isopropylmalate dehydrogenase
MMPGDGKDRIVGHDAIYLGAVGSPDLGPACTVDGPHTPDMGGEARTADLGTAIASAI